MRWTRPRYRVLDCVERALLNIELKGPGGAEPVAACVEQYVR